MAVNAAFVFESELEVNEGSITERHHGHREGPGCSIQGSEGEEAQTCDAFSDGDFAHERLDKKKREGEEEQLEDDGGAEDGQAEIADEVEQQFDQAEERLGDEPQIAPPLRA